MKHRRRLSAPATDGRW